MNYPDNLPATNENTSKATSVEVVTNNPTAANSSGQLTANAAYTYNTMQVAGVTVIDAVLTAKTGVTGTAAFSFSTFEITKSVSGTVKIVQESDMLTPPSVEVYSELTGEQAVTMGTLPANGAATSTVTATGTNFAVAFSSWKQGTADVTTFAADKPYTATCTLTAATGYKFASTATAAISGTGKGSAGEATVASDGSTMTFTYTYTTPALPVPNISTVPTAPAITYGQTLADSTLSGGSASVAGAPVTGAFAWTTSSTAPAVADSNSTEYDVTFTPTDTSAYSTATCKVKLTVNPKSLTDVAIADITDQEYTGSAITPVPTVTSSQTVNSYALVKDTDYTVSYSNNTNKGTATVTVTAKTDGNYAFTSVSKGFTIVAQAGSVSITGNLNVTYGTAVPDVVIDKHGSDGTTTVNYYTNETCTAGETTTKPTNAGNYWVRVSMAAGTNYGSAVSNIIPFTIAPATIPAAVSSAVTGYSGTYDGVAHNAVVIGTAVTGDYTVKFSTSENGAYSGVNPQITNAADSKTVWVEISRDNYTTVKKSVAAAVGKASLTISGADVAAKTFDGTAAATINSVTMSGDLDTMVKGTDYSVSGVWNSANVSAANKVTVTVTLNNTEKAANYSVAGTYDKTGLTMSKAAEQTLTDQTVSHKYTLTGVQTKSVTNAGMPANAGTLTYAAGTAGTTALVSSWTVSNVGLVNYTLSGTGAAGDTVTLPVTVTSDNYADSTVNVVITMTDKDVPVVSANNISVTYTGSVVPASAITGTATFNGAAVPGTWSWKTAAPTTVAQSGSYTVVFNPADGTNYAIVEKSITVTINKATPTGAPKYTAITAADKTLADAVLTTIGGTFSTAGTVKWVDSSNNDLADTTKVTANTAYKWLFTPNDTANYNTLTGSITPYVVAPAGGGAAASCTLTFNTNGGSAVAAVSKTSGSTVDLTGYKPTRDGYTFAGWFSDTALTKTVTSVKLTADTTVYAKWTKNGAVNPFTDVPDDAFCHDAVLWALGKNVTSGTSPTTFSPTMDCSRAQVVTFLWRAMGSPEPTGTANPFTDVSPDAYYYKAVLWAVEKGITKGATATTFAPDATVTRAQFVTFLWRAANLPAAGGTNPFTDLTDTGAYYYNAVLWAAEQAITAGTSATTFSPDDICSRGQVVTFLYRYMTK